MTEAEAIAAAAQRREPAKHGNDKLMRIVAVLTVIITAGVLTLAVFGLPKILHSASDTSTRAIGQNNTIQSCRGSFHSYYVDDATKVYDDAKTDLLLTIGHALDAVGKNDKVGFVEAVAQEPQIEVRIAAGKALVDTANTKYKAAVKLSRTDPTKFLSECEALPQ